jgi:hypothetical protein
MSEWCYMQFDLRGICRLMFVYESSSVEKLNFNDVPRETKSEYEQPSKSR